VSSSSPAPPVGPRPPLDLATKALYGLGAMGTATKQQLAGLLLLFYNEIIGLDAPVVSFAIFIALLIDAIWDPLVGQISDNTRTRWGRRHPFIYGAAPPAAVCLVLLFTPPAEWSAGALFFYLLGIVVAGRLLDSLYDIPGQALMPELTQNYDERTGVQSWRYLFSAVVARTLTAVLGFGYFLRGTKADPYGQLHQAGYAPYAITIAVISLVTVLTSALATHRFIPYLHRPARRPASFAAISREIGLAITNPNFVALAISGLIFGISIGISAGLVTYFYTYFWELGSKALFALQLWAIPAGVIGIVLAPIGSRLLGKKRTCITLFFMAIFANTIPLGGRLLGIMPPNGSPWLLPILIADTMVAGALATMGFVIVTSMLADVVEEVQVKTAQRSEGLLFAADSLLRKITTSFTTLLPGLILAYVGFPKHARPGHVDPAILTHLALIYLPITTVLTLCSTSMLFFYRIDRMRHEDNLRRIADAAALLETVDPDGVVTEGPGAVVRSV